MFARKIRVEYEFNGERHLPAAAQPQERGVMTNMSGMSIGKVARICGLAPRATAEHLIPLWKEFDAGGSAEARFAKAIDRSMPVLLNLNNRGGSWLENGVTYERVFGRVKPEIENGCPELWSYLEEQLKAAHKQGFFAVPTA